MKREWLLHFVLIVGAIVAFSYVMRLKPDTVDQHGNVQPATTGFPTRLSDRPAPSLASDKARIAKADAFSNNYGSLRAILTVENLTDRPLSFIMIECICEDANQRPYGTGSASVRDLRARESVRTEGNCSGEPTTDTATISCRIESVYD